MKDRKPKLTLEEELDIAPQPITLNEVVVQTHGYEQDLIDDYALIRKKIIFAMERNSEVIDESVRNVLQDSDSRKIETAAAALKALADNAGALMKIHESMSDLMRERKLEKPDECNKEEKLKTSFNKIIKLVDKRAANQ
jgi:hypothetical protein